MVPSREGLASAGVPPAAPRPDPDAVEARARECDCPPQIEQCVHFDGRYVVLHRGRRSDPGEYRVCWGYGVPGIAENKIWFNHLDPHKTINHSDHDAARAAFDAAAERLRAGELDSQVAP